MIAAQAVEAANLQNKFWELHDLLYAQQNNWVNLSEADFEQWVAAQASGLGMNVEQYQTDLKSETVVNLIQSNYEEARTFGPFGVPLIIINGEIYLTTAGLHQHKRHRGIDPNGQTTFRRLPTDDRGKDKQYIATLHTDCQSLANAPHR